MKKEKFLVDISRLLEVLQEEFGNDSILSVVCGPNEDPIRKAREVVSRRVISLPARFDVWVEEEKEE